MKYSIGFLILFTLASCSKDNNDSGSSTSYMKLWVNNFEEVNTKLATVALGNNSISIIGGWQKGANDNSVSLILSDAKTPGTYNLGQFYSHYGTVDYGGELFLTNEVPNAGKVVITNLTNKRVSGTFSFNASSPVPLGGAINITKGEFDINY